MPNPVWMWGIVYTAVVLFPLLLLGGGMFYIDLYLNEKTDFIILFIILFPRMPQNIWWKTNQYIIKYVINIPHNFDSAHLLSIRLLPSINRSLWVTIFPQKATTTVCLGFCINPSSMTSGFCSFALAQKPDQPLHLLQPQDSLNFNGSLFVLLYTWRRRVVW